LSPKSLWSKISQIDAKKAREMAEYFETRSRYEDQRKINNQIIDLLNPEDGEKILDLGCGTGILTRLIAPNVFPGGLIRGIDISPHFVELARNKVQEFRYSSIIKFDVGDVEKLPYPDELFDATFGARLFLYVNNPQQAVKEIKRVVKKKGRIVLADWDFDTLVIDHSNRLLTRKIIHWRTDNKDGNNWSGRQLFRLLKQQNIEDIVVKPVVTIAIDKENSLTQSIFNAASGAFKANIITTNEYESWITELKKKIQIRTFFASIGYFLVKGIKA
jgi:ubiquinone/menaquinone biosynthesis C-methylase UbiE